MASTVIPPGQSWALWAVLLTAAATGVWAERTRWGARLSGAIVTMTVTFLLSNLRVIPSQAPTYDVVWSYLVPLAIPLLLLRADLRRIVREAGPTLVAFGFGAAGTIAGTVVAVKTLPLGPEGWKLGGIFCATYVGGSMNYVAVAQALDLRSSDLLAAGVAADNLAMAVYFAILFALPAVAFLRRAMPDRAAGSAGPGVGARRPPTVLGMSGALAASGAACAVGFGVADAVGVPAAGILVLTALTVGAASLFPRYLSRLDGAEDVGVILFQVFFATIGASANLGVVLRVGPVLFALAAVILTIHLAVILLAGRLLRLDLREVVIASNANMGGPTTAAAMASARSWDHLVVPAILCGTLGYAVATFLGVAVGTLLR